MYLVLLTNPNWDNKLAVRSITEGIE